MLNRYEMQKICCRSLPLTTLKRESLIDALRQTSNTASGRKLSLICAPAGSGKTTLLTHFAKASSLPCCWYHFDQGDQDRIVFLRLLLASIRSHFPGFGKRIDYLITSIIGDPAEQQHAKFHPFLDALCEALATDIAEPFAFIFCNYQEVNNNASFIAFLAYFIEQAPAHCHFFIESRVLPSMSLPLLFLHEQVGGLSASNLFFSAQEVRDLASLLGVALEDDEAEQMVTAFGGWITGILLGTRLSRLQRLQLIRHQQNQELLLAYVTEEAFKHAPAAYTFLQEAAILEFMPPALCNALLTRSDAADLLQQLEEERLFVTSQTIEDQTTYICHSAIRNLLSTHLREHAEARWTSLHCRAAELWAAQGNYDQALSHAHAIDAHDLAAQLILAAHTRLQESGHTDKLIYWIDALPLETLDSHPRLLLLRARLAVTLGNIPAIIPFLDRAQAASIPQDADPKGYHDYAMLQTEIHLLRAKSLFHAGQYQQAEALCQHILPLIPTDERQLQAEAHLRLGVCANLLGAPGTGLEYLLNALVYWGDMSVASLLAEIQGALANTYSSLGAFVLAEHHLACERRCYEYLHHERGTIDNLLRTGMVLLDQGKLDEATSTYTQAIELARSSLCYHRGEAYALTNLGYLCLLQGAEAQALDFMEQGLRLAQQLGDQRQIRHTLCNLATVRLFLRDTVGASHLLVKVEEQLPQGETLDYEQIRCLLIRGLISMHQGNSDLALRCLIPTLSFLEKAGLERELIQAKLRIAACLLANREESEAIHHVEAVALKLITTGHYKHIVLWELRLHPGLLQAVQTWPATATLRKLLELASEDPQQEGDSPQPFAPAIEIPMHSDTIKLFALGEPTILINDQPVTKWRMPSAQELLFFLLDARKPKSKEQIITALWDGKLEESTSQALHSTVYYLRKIIGVSCLLRQKDGYTLHLSGRFGQEIWYDVAAFQTSWHQADFALQAANDLEAREALLTMVELYRGAYLQSCYSQWTTSRREELEELYLEALRQLGQLAYRQKQFGESIKYWRQILSIDEFQEEAHLGLIRCYLAQRKRDHALNHYQQYVRLWQQEFDAPPSPRMQKLSQQLN